MLFSERVMSRSERVVSSNNVLQFRVPILNLFFRLRARVSTLLALATSDAGSTEASIASEQRKAVSRQGSSHISSVRVIGEVFASSYCRLAKSDSSVLQFSFTL